MLSMTTCGVLGQQQTLPLIPFQGRLTDSKGLAVPDGMKIIQFQIYGEPTGGQALWAGEVHRTTVNGGLVNVILGSRNPLPANRADRPDRSFFDATLYLQITVDGNGDGAVDKADPPLLPRQSIFPQAFSTDAANSRLLAGHDWSALFGSNDPTGTLLPTRIADGSVPAVKLAPASITSNQIAPSTINGSLIRSGSVSSEQIAAGGIDVTRLAQAVAEALVPPGTIMAFGGPAETVPTGWVLCDGRTLTTASFVRLYNVIGTSWGAPRSGEFRVPDLRGLFLRGVDSSPMTGVSGRDPNSSDSDRSELHSGGNIGNRVGSWQPQAIESHHHEMESPAIEIGHSINGNGSTFRIDGDDGPPWNDRSWPFRTKSGGGSETRPANVYVNYIIKL